MEYSIYKHTFPNGKVYIGITNGEPEKRWKDGHGYKGQKLIMDAIIKYGWDNIKHEVLYSNLDKNSAKELESSLIREAQSYKYDFGYNVLIGDYALKVLDIKNSNTNDYIENQRNKCKTKKAVMCIETGKIYNSLKQAQNELGISYMRISSVCKGKSKTAGGYHWVFV